jgi:hypothetical protein
MDDFALDATMLLLTHVGAASHDVPERVDGDNPSHPGQTFDYFVTAQDGRSLSVEVTRAWDERFLGAQKQWKRFVKQIETEMRLSDPTLRGWFTINVDPEYTTWPSDFDKADFVSAVRTVTPRPSGLPVHLDDGVTVSNFTRPPVSELRVTPTFSSGEFELGQRSRGRFARAIERKLGTMEKAGATGYETHLAIIHWALGSTASWRQFLIEQPPTFDHPQFIWAVDLNAQQGTQGRQSVEQLWPRASGRNGSSRDREWKP